MMKNKQNKGKSKIKPILSRLSLQTLKPSKTNSKIGKKSAKDNISKNNRSVPIKSQKIKVFHSSRQKRRKLSKLSSKDNNQQNHRDTPQLGKGHIDNPHLHSFNNMFINSQEIKHEVIRNDLQKDNAPQYHTINIKPKSNIKQVSSHLYNDETSLEEGQSQTGKTSNITQRQLDLTIGRLKTKKHTVQLLNKTINHKLVQSFHTINKTARSDIRSQVLDVQIHYYVQKITQLQKELQQKNATIDKMAVNYNELEFMSRNNKKLEDENVRLRDYLELSHRENEALRKIINKKKGII